MKDIVIKGKSIRRELFVLLACIVAAELVNVGCIIYWARPVSELWSMIGMVVCFGVVVYCLAAIVRILIHYIVKLIKH